MEDFRRETDLLGERVLPAAAYWGIHTLRAREHGAVSGLRMSAEFWQAYAIVKKACCLANETLGFFGDGESAGYCPGL